jgi:hypothetical protein
MVVAQLLSTGQQIISARNATDAHAQDFELNDKVLLFILQAFAQCGRSLQYMLLKMLDVFSLCSNTTDCRSPVVPPSQQFSAPHQTWIPSPRRGNHPVVGSLYRRNTSTSSEGMKKPRQTSVRIVGAPAQFRITHFSNNTIAKRYRWKLSAQRVLRHSNGRSSPYAPVALMLFQHSNNPQVSTSFQMTRQNTMAYYRNYHMSRN